jgi:hypothetical protein
MVNEVAPQREAAILELKRLCLVGDQQKTVSPPQVQKPLTVHVFAQHPRSA